MYLSFLDFLLFIDSHCILLQMYAYINRDLFSGSTAELSGDTTMRAGSLLDDNQWHEVIITRDLRQISFNVDRMEITNVSASDFIQLDLDRKVISHSNFWGRLNVWEMINYLLHIWYYVRQITDILCI